VSDSTLVATLGDSIVAGSPGYDPDPREREALGFGADEKSQWQYWAHRLHPDLEFRNCGMYGQRTDEIARRLDDCAKSAQVLVVQGGINDIAQQRSVADAARNLEAMVERGIEAGLAVAVADVLPWPAGDARAAIEIARLNDLVRTMAGVTHLPFHEAVASAGFDWSDDGDHPSVGGYRLLGECAAPLLAR
jgi:lysophospholipase L1-like esterase